MDLDTVADQLYALDPADFTAARNACTKQARTDGERDLAQQIMSLRRPTTAAWLVNQLVREHRDEVAPLLDLGRELREVMADLGAEELRELTRQRYRLVSALVRLAAGLALAHGHPVGDSTERDVRSTLEATLADPASADAVATGRLTEALAPGGFGAGPTTATGGQATVASTGPQVRRQPSTTPPSATASLSDLDAARARRLRHRAQQDVDLAARESAKLSERRDAVRDGLAAIGQRYREAADEVLRLREELDRVQGELQQLEDEESAAGHDAEAAEVAAADAAEQLREARRRLESLPD